MKSQKENANNALQYLQLAKTELVDCKTVSMPLLEAKADLECSIRQLKKFIQGIKIAEANSANQKGLFDEE